MNLRFPVLAALLFLLLAPAVHAQYEIQGGAANLLDARRAGGFATLTGGNVTSITVRSGGLGYTSAPVVIIGAPGGSGNTATATAVLTAGRVSSITINSGGSGYTAPPEVTIAGPSIPTGLGTTTPQYAGVGGTSLSSAGIDSRGLITSTNANTAGTLGSTAATRYPKAEDKTIPAVPKVTVLLARSSGGYSLASGVPRFSFGDVIERPQVTWSGTIAPATYWRSKPVQPGETFSSAYLANLNGASQPLLPLGSVSVTTASPQSRVVTVAAVPDGLVSGATLLGQRVDIVDGLNITLRNKPNVTITSATNHPFSIPEFYYYSPHADKVFATQPGRVTITWVSNVPDTSAAGESTPTYKFKTEVFSVASAPTVPQRTIYWTENSFTGPKVEIPAGRIEAANVVYNSFMPSHVAAEYVPTGSSPAADGASAPAELRTMWYDNSYGSATLRAYNEEGMLFVEYLGTENLSTGARAFLGADVVSVRKKMESVEIETPLGQQLLPREGAAQAGDDLLRPSVVTNTSNTGKPLYGTSALPNGMLVYHAERANSNPDNINIFWLESQDLAIHFLAAPATPGMSIRWPKISAKYTQVWPTSLADYEPITVTDLGSGIAIGPIFDAAKAPSVVFQDDPAEVEVSLDVATQRLLADFGASADKTNRSLLKFASGDVPWYVPVYIQSQSLLGSPALPDPDGSGPLTATPAVATINDTNADGVLDLTATVAVGQRIEPPAGYSVAGYIASGDNYYPAGYLNPFTVGVKAAEAGAIIPVNALPGKNQLTIWWFKEVAAPSQKFASFHLPSVVGRYTVEYPTDAPQLVIASGIGTGDLGPSQQAGSVYVQNDATQPGFNPNEEHAFLLGSRAYALRDDLNSASTTSEPFVLLAYTSAADDRPSMDVYELLRETFAYPLRYDAIAGTKVQPPGPLFALPLPIDGNGEVLNYEVEGVPDLAAGSGAPASYATFTFQDRQGYDWTYRGAHAKTSASATASVTSGGVSNITVSLKGAGYATAPAVSVAPPTSGTTATATATLGGLSAASFTIASGNKTYSVAPTVTISGGGGSGATATALLSNGLVTGINMTAAGTGYTTAPTITFSGGTQLVAGTAPTGSGNTTGFCVTAITVTSAGTGYTAAPEIRIAPPVSFGMRFFYNSLPGFFEPSLSLTDQRPVGTVMPFIADTGNDVPVALTYQPKWPDDPTLPIAQQKIVPVLQTAQTLTLPKASAVAGQLPQVRGSSSAQVIYQQSIANTGTTTESAILHDPTRQKQFLMTTGMLDKLPPSVLTTVYAGKTYFQSLPPHLQQRFYYDPTLGTKGGLVLKGEFVDEIAGEDYLHLNVLGTADLALLQALCPSSDNSYKSLWDTAINQLATQLETSSEDPAAPGSYEVDGAKDSRVIDKSTLVDIRDPDTAVDSYALTATGNGSGYVVLMLENGEAFTDSGNPPTMQVLKVDPSLYTGDLKVLLASNPLDEQVTLRHSGDYAGKPELYEFQWRYGYPTGGTNPAITGDNINTVSSTSTWLKPDGLLGGSILVGGSPTATISNTAVLMGDTYFTLNYRKIGGTWSGWTPPVLVEGWIKRVLAKINPFNQRMSDLSSNAVNTDVSLLTQAGKRWEGDIALNLENINEVGLIEIYETVLNRGKSFTIGSSIDFNSANSALILAAGYLNDLYTILGNEAYADAANPTISIDDSTSATEVNTSRFSFEGQVRSSLDEELALLKGRDDFVNPGTGTAPAYNRLWWNYTRGINSGEVLYATNYNIKEKAGSSTENGVVDAADAQRMFPQGHGDAYGHYLTALKGYYKLLTHPYFTWTTSAEDVTVLGQSVQIDYKDERKFAAAAANAASTATQTVALVHRQSYVDDPAAGWSHLRDGKVNPRTGVTRHQGLDEWVARSAQGSFLNWVAGNALLPAVDTDPNHSGVQIIDRTTVPELGQLVAAANSFQTAIDNANARLNPLGLSPGAIAFDISPSKLQAGESHFEQIYQRALRATLNAKGAFNQAARMTRLLRNQENQIADANTAIVDQEIAFDNELQDIFGSPYPGDVGPGKTYAQGYEGPDYENWFLVDRPTDLVDTSTAVELSIAVPTGIEDFSSRLPQDVENQNSTTYLAPNAYSAGDLAAHFLAGPAGTPTGSTQKTVTVRPGQIAQWAQDWGGGSLGQRAVTGSLQQALLDSHQAQVALLKSVQQVQVLQKRMTREQQLFNDLVASHIRSDTARAEFATEYARLVGIQDQLENSAAATSTLADQVYNTMETSTEFLPNMVGFATDVFAGIRGVIASSGSLMYNILSTTSIGLEAGANSYDKQIQQKFIEFDTAIEALAFPYEQRQQYYEYELLYRELMASHFEVTQRATDYQRANEQVRNVLADAGDILSLRETFRMRAAAQVTGYRTNDLTFRTFRNEALEQYRTLYDLAGRYTYLAAKSYDYETGLLGTTAGQQVISNIVASRALGDLSGDQPQATVSTLGDAGLAGTMAQLNADFSVAEGRLGINNPDPYGTLFSLRSELFRIQDDPTKTSDDDAWKQAVQQHIVADLMADPDVARYCNNLKKPDGSPAPGIVISFGSSIQHGKNFFGLPLAAGDHAYTPSSYATKIMSSGVVLKGYEGMDPYAFATPGAGSPASGGANALSANPYVYLIPCGSDYMLAPPLGDTNTLRSWTVHDQALPLPYNLGASAFNTTNFFDANGTLSEQPWILRKHQAFRPVSDPAFFYSPIPTEFTNTRLVGRSVWNGRWKIVIPAYTLLENEQDALNRFVASVKDIQLFLRTYSNSGN
jgi:hypothetical protein